MAAVLLGSFSARSGDSVTPASTEIDAQIQRLNSADFETREAALVALRRMGAAVLKQTQAARDAADEDNPELESRLDAVLNGPRVGRYCAAGWIKLLKANNYEDRSEALRALESMDETALPQIETLVECNDAYLCHAGLWLAVRLGDRAHACAGTVARLLSGELAALEEREAAGEKDGETWPLFIHPRSPDLGDPPVVDFNLGEHDGDAYSYAYDIMSRIESITFERRRVCLLRPWSDVVRPSEAAGQLRGVALALCFCPQDRTESVRILPSLNLTILCHSLERLGADGPAEALLKRAHLKISELLSHETARP
ncbi:MAG: hypothetical protein HY291_18195 [Planctomycetes bacterium]|nr:hypothetical protein [Planctomycetota bacterium]